METVGNIQVVATINTKGYDDGKKKIESGNKELESSSKKTSSSISSSFGSVADGISSMVKVASAALITGSVGLMSFINQASDLQSITASFESLTGSIELTQSVLQQLYDFSFSTAFSTADINSAAKAWLASGLAVEDLGTIMSEVGDIAGATGADLGSLTLPLTQAMARGKLQTQDYYQILNSGAGAFAKVLQKEVTERGLGNLQDALSDGTVTTEVMLSALSKANAAGGFAFEGALKQSKTFSGQMSNLMETIGNVGLEIIGVNKATGEIDPNGIFAQLSLVVQNTTKWLTDNKQQIKDIAMIIIDNVIPAVSGLAAAFITMKTVSVIFAIIANPMMLIPIAIAAIIAALVFLQVKFNIFGKAWDAIKGAWGTAVAFFIGVFKAIGNAISTTLASIGKWFSNLFTGIWSAIVGMFNAIVGFIQKWGITILAILFWPYSLLVGLFFKFKTQILGFLSAIWAAVVDIFTPIGQFFTTIFQGAWNIIITIFGAIGTWFAEQWDMVVSVFSVVDKFFSDIFQSAWNIIVGIFSAVGGFFKGVWNTIVGLFTPIGTSIGNAIGGAFKSVINTVLNFAVGFINGFIDAINGAISIINNIPGVNIGLIGKLSVPQLADGGIVSSPTLAMIGEGKGPEAVVPLSKINSLLDNSDTSKSRDVIINQTNNVNTELDMDVINRNMTWQLRRA